jgi:hypothetical protein
LPPRRAPTATCNPAHSSAAAAGFDRRNGKAIALSVDPLDQHEKWVGDIERTQGAAFDFPSGISKVESFRSVGTGVVPNMRRSQYLVSLSP